MRSLVFAALLLVSAIAASPAQSNAAAPGGDCGEVVTIETHSRTTTRYALARPGGAPAQGGRIALVLLIGGGGNLNLDDKGCPRSLSRNVLMRMMPLFHGASFVTVLVDAPSDASGGDGLAEFWTAPQHADDLGKLIADLRTRTKGAVWLLGHSRGTISAANAAPRLSGQAAADGAVLMSAMMSGDPRARKPLARQSVFDLPLATIKAPLLVIGHTADNCERSPAGLMENITARIQGMRKQAATITGGPIKPGRPPNLSACEGREPHDYVDQESEVAAGILRFIRGGSY